MDLKKLFASLEAKVEPIKWSETKYRPTADAKKIDQDVEQTFKNIEEILKKNSE